MQPGLGPGQVGALLESCLLCHLFQTLAPDTLGVLAKWAAPEPCLSPCSGSALLQHGHAVLRPWGQPCCQATKPFWPFPSLCPVERSCRSHMPGRTQWVPAMPGWTSQATTGVAFFPFSSRAASVCGAGGMVLNVLWMETVMERTWLGASTASPAHFGAETHACEQCLWTPMLHSL